MNGLNLVQKVAPAPPAFSQFHQASRTSVCHLGSLRTSDTKAKTSAGGRAIDSVLSVIIVVPLSTALPDSCTREAGRVDRLPRGVHVRRLPGTKRLAQIVRSGTEILLAGDVIDVVEGIAQMLGDHLHVELHG